MPQRIWAARPVMLSEKQKKVKLGRPLLDEDILGQGVVVSLDHVRHTIEGGYTQ